MTRVLKWKGIVTLLKRSINIIKGQSETVDVRPKGIMGFNMNNCELMKHLQIKVSVTKYG